MHVKTLLQMLLLATVHVNTSLEALFEASHLFSDMALYGHVVAIMNCYGIKNLLLQKFTFTENLTPLFETRSVDRTNKQRTNYGTEDKYS